MLTSLIKCQRFYVCRSETTVSPPAGTRAGNKGKECKLGKQKR